VVEALRKLIKELGWRAEVVEFHSWRVGLVVRPPLARSQPDRNRWPDEPEEGPEDLLPGWDPDRVYAEQNAHKGGG
jgi:hypothetical protein